MIWFSTVNYLRERKFLPYYIRVLFKSIKFIANCFQKDDSLLIDTGLKIFFFFFIFIHNNIIYSFLSEIDETDKNDSKINLKIIIQKIDGDVLLIKFMNIFFFYLFFLFIIFLNIFCFYFIPYFYLKNKSRIMR